jgi:cephalosporin hydroxylase
VYSLARPNEEWRDRPMRNSLGPIVIALNVACIGCVSAGEDCPPCAECKEIAPDCSEKTVLTQFHKLWYSSNHTWKKNTWMGIKTMQSPQDVWIAQEVIFETKPDFIVECGAYHGGSAAMWAMILKEANPEGRVISIDIEDRFDKAKELSIVKERVEFIVGSSTAPEVVAKIKEEVSGKKVLVILDSLHKKHHVLDELNNYWDIVPVGGYIHVQDSNINGHPVLKKYGPGPMEAIKEFLKTNKHFQIDKSRERMLFSLHPDGWLKRIN